MSSLKVGDRVRLSAAGCSALGHHRRGQPERVGTLLQICKDGRLIVLWDGRSAPTSRHRYHVRMLERVVAVPVQPREDGLGLA